MSYSQLFLVKPGTKIRLSSYDPDFSDLEKEAAVKQTEANKLRLHELQELMYAEHKRSLLICLQAIDAGGKDGAINRVIGAMNPQGCRVASFKVPTALEADHDFLWRIHKEAPAKGEVTVFNRSHYEQVLTVRVHKLMPKPIWSGYYGLINNFEQHLAASGTHIVKFFLHISKEEQLKRFKARLDDPLKHWKLNTSDYADRKLWNEYEQAFEDMLSKCSTESAPWFVIPANRKWFRDLAISQILVDYMEGMKMKLPAPTVDIEQIRKEYLAAEKAG